MDARRLHPLIDQLHSFGCRVSLFVDAGVDGLESAKAIGADYYCKDARAGVTVAETVFGQDKKS